MMEELAEQEEDVAYCGMTDMFLDDRGILFEKLIKV
jgi:hypothetical protein